MTTSTPVKGSSLEELDADVIVVGAGPSGLTVAAELALAGVRVLVFERRTGPVQSRAGTILPRVLELLDARGLAQTFIDRARTIRENPLFRIHIWAGMQPVRWDYLDSRFGYRLILPQNDTEELLGTHAASLGVNIRTGTSIDTIEQGEDDVHVVATGPEGRSIKARAKFLVGADGGRSIVRSQTGINFVGHDATFTGIVADVVISNPWPEGRRMVDNQHGWVTSFPFSSDQPVTRFNLVHADRRTAHPSEPVTIEEVRQCLAEILEFDLGFTELRWASRFTDTMRMADAFSSGRVFLVGESARIHYPSSGVGMNFCLQDAFNLGWKLAAVVNGHASENLLESYESERRPVAEALLDSVRSQCAVQFNFSPEGVAFKRWFESHVMPIREVNRRLALELNGLTEPYQSPPDSHPMTGQRVPDLELQTPHGLVRIGELLRSQHFLLIDCTGNDAYQSLSFPHAPVTTVSAIPTSMPPELHGARTIIVRPDAYLGWVDTGPADPGQARKQLTKWLDLLD